MKTFVTVPLDNDWEWRPIDADGNLASSGGVLHLPDMNNLAIGNTHIQLRHVFSVEPIHDICLNFFLVLDNVDGISLVQLRGNQLAFTQQGEHFVCNVTDFLMLEGNELVITTTVPIRFSSVSLRRVPCDTDL